MSISTSKAGKAPPATARTAARGGGAWKSAVASAVAVDAQGSLKSRAEAGYIRLQKEIDESFRLQRQSIQSYFSTYDDFLKSMESHSAEYVLIESRIKPI